MAWQKMTDKQKKEYMDGKRKDAVTRLTAQVQALTESESWKEWLHWQARFHSYSFCNAVLIKGQCPEASAVGGYKSVWEPAGYRIRKGEKAISIFGKPWVVEKEQENDEGEVEVAAYRRYPILSVWDISQLEPTENAKPMPELAKAISGVDHEADLGTLLRFAKSNGIEVEVKSIKGSKGGAISRDGGTMILNDQKELNHNFRTVAHELAHYALHCQGRNGNQSYQSGELDAEAVAFIVADARGLDTSEYSVGYVATWAGEADKFVAHMKVRGTVIADAARWILAAFDEKGE